MGLPMTEEENVAQLSSAFITFDEASEMFTQLANVLQEIGDQIYQCTELMYEAKKTTKQFRCRICGRRYDFKSEAKACYRDHKQWRR